MDSTDDMLIKRLQNEELPQGGLSYNALGQETYPSINPVRNHADILLAETLLGCPLPPFLTRIYLEIGDGGFGPGCSLAQLFTPEQEDPWLDTLSVVHTTLLFRKCGGWPEHLLFFCSMGCTVYMCIDYHNPIHPIIEIDQTEETGFKAPSLQKWLENWLDGAATY